MPILSYFCYSQGQLECLHGRADEFKEYGYNAVLMQSDSVKYALMQHVIFFSSAAICGEFI